MMRRFLLALTLLFASAALAACDGDSFVPPDMPDRNKGPLDFAIPYNPDLFGADFSVPDQQPPDLGSVD